MYNTDRELKFAVRIQIDKAKIRESTRMYASGKWYCPNCSFVYTQREFIKDTCDYCGERLEKEW